MSFSPNRSAASTCLAQGPERGSQLRAEHLGLFPRCEVSASVDLVEVGEIGIGAPGPYLRGSIDVVREYRNSHGKRDLTLDGTTTVRAVPLDDGIGTDISIDPIATGTFGIAGYSPQPAGRYCT